MVLGKGYEKTAAFMNDLYSGQYLLSFCVISCKACLSFTAVILKEEASMQTCSLKTFLLHISCLLWCLCSVCAVRDTCVCVFLNCMHPTVIQVVAHGYYRVCLMCFCCICRVWLMLTWIGQCVQGLVFVVILDSSLWLYLLIYFILPYVSYTFLNLVCYSSFSYYLVFWFCWLVCLFIHVFF